MSIDVSAEPSIEVDETSEVIDIVWRSPGKSESFSIVIAGGKIVGVSSTLDPPRSGVAWSVALPKGLIRIDPTKMFAVLYPPLAHGASSEEVGDRTVGAEQKSVR